MIVLAMVWPMMCWLLTSVAWVLVSERLLDGGHVVDWQQVIRTSIIALRATQMPFMLAAFLGVLGLRMKGRTPP